MYKNLKYFLILLFLSPLNAIRFERTHFKVISSTQDYIRDNIDILFSDPSKQLVVTADEQTKGRGTHNRRWASPADVNIYATFGLIVPFEKVEEIKKSPHLTQLVSIAVVQTLNAFGLNPQIKWVNDVWLNRAKICGILCESIPTSNPERVVGLIGIGLNVNMPKEICDSLDQPVTSMGVASGKIFNKEEVFEVLVTKLSINLDFWFKYGFLPIASELDNYMAFKGETIRLQDETTGTITIGKFLRIDQEGNLHLELEDGSEKSFLTGRLLREKGIDVDEHGNSLFK